MTDAPTSWLIRQLQQEATLNSLWFSDENVLHQLPDPTAWPEKPTLITNRWDIAEQAKQVSFPVLFNDFDVSHIADNSIDTIFYRISKEKAVTHHLLNQAVRILKPAGTLYVSGQKNEGIKTYIEKACELFGCEKNIRKEGMSYSGVIQKNQQPTSLLNDDNYTQLRECFNIHQQPVFSKPGQFGWNKIDQGSEFLIAGINALLAPEKRFSACLDLGCGYGYLTIASQALPIGTRVLTDNNAAALRTAAHNCRLLNIDGLVIGSDAGQQIQQHFDLILCNPPFHQGFSVDGDLTDKFLTSASQLLTPDGVAYFVVNQFIPLEKKAGSLFSSVKIIAQNKSFKVIELHKK